MDVCAGGTVSGKSITFINHRPKPCTVTGLGNLVDCGNSFTIPAKSGGGNPGTLTCGILAGAPKGSYPYQADCCDKQTNPVIIYQ
jgi:hypothetical protein